MLSRTNSVGRLVSNFEHSNGGGGSGGLNAAANRFLLERQRSSPSLPNSSSGQSENGNGGQRITKPTWKPPVPSALSKPVTLKTRFRLGDGDVEIDPSADSSNHATSSNHPTSSSHPPPGRSRDFRGPTSLTKPPVPTGSKPTLRHTVRSALYLVLLTR